MEHAVVLSDRVLSAESRVLGTQIAPELFLGRVVDRVLVPGEVFGFREALVAVLSCAGVNPVASIWPGLRSAIRRRRLEDANAY